MNRRDYLKALAAAPFVSTDQPEAVSVEETNTDQIVRVDTSGGAVTVTLSDYDTSKSVRIVRTGPHPVHVCESGGV